MSAEKSTLEETNWMSKIFVDDIHVESYFLYDGRAHDELTGKHMIVDYWSACCERHEVEVYVADCYCPD